MGKTELIAAREMLEIVPLIMRTLRPEIKHLPGLPNAGHFHVLRALGEGEHNLSSLAEKHNVTLPTMSKTITTLCGYGFVQRAQSKDDRRQVDIKLTDEGRSILAKIREHTEGHIAEILTPLPQEEKQILIAGLAILKKAFNGTSKKQAARPIKRG